MGISKNIDSDLKQAMLTGDKTLVTTLRGLKSAILYEEVAKGSRGEGLSDDVITQLLSKEAKKRHESAELYEKGGNKEKAQAELVEKEVIEKYLPAQMSDEDLSAAIDKAISDTGAQTIAQLGQVIGAVKSKVGSTADGSRIATVAKARLAK